MRKIVSNFFMSLDGAIASPEKWSISYWNDEIEKALTASMFDADAMLLGRITYQGFAESWSGRTVEDDPGADHMNSVRKYVASRTLTDADVTWNNSSLLHGDLASSIRELKATEGGTITTSGSPTLVRSLLEHSLVDELHLLIYPVVVGGSRLFADDPPALTMTLASSTAFSNGVVHLAYTPAA